MVKQIELRLIGCFGLKKREYIVLELMVRFWLLFVICREQVIFLNLLLFLFVVVMFFIIVLLGAFFFIEYCVGWGRNCGVLLLMSIRDIDIVVVDVRIEEGGLVEFVVIIVKFILWLFLQFSCFFKVIVFGIIYIYIEIYYLLVKKLYI